MAENLQINYKPTDAEMAQISNFLLEDGDFPDAFYCDWQLIKRAHSINRIVSFQYDNKCIGFVFWRDGGFVIDINVFFIRREFRKQGFGQCFFDMIFLSFKKKKAKVVKLYCEPPESRWFWKKMGFVQFPNIGHGKELTFFKNLFPIAEITENPDPWNKIELWDLEPIYSKGKKPRWIWNLNIEDSELKKPILQACNTKWKIKITRNGEVIQDCRVEKLRKGDDQLYLDDFLYIERS